MRGRVESDIELLVLLVKIVRGFFQTDDLKVGVDQVVVLLAKLLVLLDELYSGASCTRPLDQLPKVL